MIFSNRRTIFCDDDDDDDDNDNQHWRNQDSVTGVQFTLCPYFPFI